MDLTQNLGHLRFQTFPCGFNYSKTSRKIAAISDARARQSQHVAALEKADMLKHQSSKIKTTSSLLEDFTTQWDLLLYYTGATPTKRPSMMSAQQPQAA